MRLFVSIGFDEMFVEALEKLAIELQSRSCGGNFTRSENWHLTLAFLGEVEVASVPAVLQAMSRVLVEPFFLQLKRMGTFPGKGDGTLFWVGLEQNPALIRAVTQLRQSLLEQGIHSDPKPFVPHLTIGREVRLRNEWIGKPLPEVSPVRCRIDRITLMESSRDHEQLVYREIGMKML